MKLTESQYQRIADTAVRGPVLCRAFFRFAINCFLIAMTYIHAPLENFVRAQIGSSSQIEIVDVADGNWLCFAV